MAETATKAAKSKPKAPKAEEEFFEVTEVPEPEPVSVEDPPQSAGGPVCVACGLPVSNHTEELFEECLTKIAPVKLLEKPLASTVHAFSLFSRLGIPLSVSQDQGDFVLTIRHQKIETREPARVACAWLLENAE